MKTRYFFAVAALMLICLLFGCGAAVVGGVGYGGYKTATDERTVGTMVDDSKLALAIKTKMISDEFVKARHVDVDVLNGTVYLIGVVETASQKRMAGDLARGFDGVRTVENQLVVGSTTVGQILDDSFLTSKIKVALLKEPNIRSNNVGVDTHNNIVTLTGMVSSKNEKSRILYVTQQISGNRQIVDNLRIAP